MVPILYLIEGTPRGFLERDKTNIPKINGAFFNKMMKTRDGVKRNKLINAHMRLQRRVHTMPNSFIK